MQAEEADVATARRVAAAFAAGEPISVELLLCTKGETRMWGQISFTPVLSETNGSVENHVCFQFPLSVLDSQYPARYIFHQSCPKCQTAPGGHENSE